MTADFRQDSHESVPTMGGRRDTDLSNLPLRKVHRLSEERAHDPCFTRAVAQISCLGVKSQRRRVGQRHVDDAASRDFERGVVSVTGALQQSAITGVLVYVEKKLALWLTVPRWDDALGEC